jgi:hypothetical protein
MMLTKRTLIRVVIGAIFVSSLLYGFFSRNTNSRQTAPEGRTASSEGRARESYADLPIYFEANRGQFDESVRYAARGASHSLFLTATDAVYLLQGQRSENKSSQRAVGR